MNTGEYNFFRMNVVLIRIAGAFWIWGFVLQKKYKVVGIACFVVLIYINHRELRHVGVNQEKKREKERGRKNVMFIGKRNGMTSETNRFLVVHPCHIWPFCLQPHWIIIVTPPSMKVIISFQNNKVVGKAAFQEDMS